MEKLPLFPTLHNFLRGFPLLGCCCSTESQQGTPEGLGYCRLGLAGEGAFFMLCGAKLHRGAKTPVAKGIQAR